jgi:hypothetical protein
MDISDRDRLTPSVKQPGKSRLPRAFLIMVAIILLVGASYYYGVHQRNDGPAEPMVVGDTTPAASPPNNHLSSGEMAADSPVQKKLPYPPLPSLVESDDYLREHWQELQLPIEIQPWLENEFLLQRTASFLDGLASGELLSQYTPLANSKPLTIPGSFKATRNSGQLVLDQQNFRRYKEFVDFIMSVNTRHVANLFRWFLPLLESSYTSLGQPSVKPGSQLIAKINLILDTPDTPSPISLKLESAFYQFADPSLEALPNSQKLLLRMGPEHSAAIKQWLGSLKNELLAE